MILEVKTLFFDCNKSAFQPVTKYEEMKSYANIERIRNTMNIREVE